jgi:hypothetical protein
MANAHVYGIRYFRSLSGNETPQILTFPIASGYAPVTVVGAGSGVNLNIGDPVKLLEDGTIALVQTGQDNSGANADSDDYAFGIIAGFPRVVVGGFPRPGSFYTSGTTYSGGIGGDSAPLVAVIPVAGNIFEIDADAVVGAGTKGAAMAVVGQTARIAYSLLTSGTGQPKANPLLDVSDLAAGGADQMQLVVVGLGKKGDAMDFESSGVTFQVMFTAQQLAVAPDAAIFGANTE